MKTRTDINVIHNLEISRGNNSMIEEFILVGLKDLYHFRIPVFLLVIIAYVATILGNMLIIVLVSTNHHFQSPMYFFLSHLSLCDILISTNVTPNTLQVILRGESVISFSNCLTQLYFFGASAIQECCLLTIMSYDRYLAICNPLLYTSIMKHNLPRYLILWPWLAGFLLSMITNILVFELYFCGPNIINHFFCDLAPLLELSCSDTSAVEIHVSVVVIVMGISQMLFVIATYICIFYSILNISSNIGRQKAFSTCSSHLGVVSTYYGTLIALYLAPARGYSLTLNKVLSLLNTVVTPLFNPIIYSLRNKEIRIETVKLLSKGN
ncbi:hypothetical protein XELAEV_18019463mg [Xenopus laevis]|uniref:G-protein coupled receptors family 1 profile domain-containing protein n=2 Tax=Xenopus laevis TaxID=8355 RepID=A0A974DHA5_XENLA|nr:hypothetical protein XELAEV_18019463mg [Xenopus laevis]